VAVRRIDDDDVGAGGDQGLDARVVVHAGGGADAQAAARVLRGVRELLLAL